MIRLLVDSASDILQNNAENIYVVPLSINILNQDYLDGVEINNDDFYAKLTSGKVVSLCVPRYLTRIAVNQLMREEIQENQKVSLNSFFKEIYYTSNTVF